MAICAAHRRAFGSWSMIGTLKDSRSDRSGSLVLKEGGLVTLTFPAPGAAVVGRRRRSPLDGEFTLAARRAARVLREKDCIFIHCEVKRVQTQGTSLIIDTLYR